MIGLRRAFEAELSVKVGELQPLREERARLKVVRAVAGRLSAEQAERLRIVETYLEGIREAIENLSDYLRGTTLVVGE